MQEKEELNRISEGIIGAAIEVHRSLGPGLLESAYEACLAYELTERGWAVEAQHALPLVYKGLRLETGYRLDLLVANQVIVEIKAIDRLMPIHQAQMITYLRLSGLRVGLLMNFNDVTLTAGLRRIVF